MPTQLRLFSANGAENFSRLEKEVNDWLAAKGDRIQPVNSQTAAPSRTLEATKGPKRWLSHFGISTHPSRNAVITETDRCPLCVKR
jgi:hypothetical protein